MQEICHKFDQADGYIFVTPVFMGTVSAIMKAFCERFCWVSSKPGRWPIKGCPTPRNRRKRATIPIMSTAIISTWLRKFCDATTKFFRGSIPGILNAEIIGALLAGSVGMENPKSDRDFSKATVLGKKLGRVLFHRQEQSLRPQPRIII